MAYVKPALESLDNWKTFTRRIYDMWDADPGYYAIQHTGLNWSQRLRLAVAWCAYYNLGIAAEASELQGKRFWQYLIDIYPTAKRSTERRHFRGGQGMRALEQWRTRWPKPEALADFMCADSRTYFDIRKAGKQVMQYGDYFFWKWCDLHEVLGYGAVDMTNSEKHSPLLPKKGAELIYQLRTDGNVFDPDDTNAIVKDVYAEIVRFGQRREVPPRTTDMRPFDIQEAETVACVYKQMASGSYIYGTRTAKAVRKLRAAEGKTAHAMAGTLLELSPYSEAELNEALDSLTE